MRCPVAKKKTNQTKAGAQLKLYKANRKKGMSISAAAKGARRKVR